MKLHAIAILSLLPVIIIRAQSIELKAAEFLNNKIVVHYDLADSIAGRSYSVRLYSSADGFINPLTKIAGDAGLEIKPGINKKVQWSPSEELGQTFEGNVSLELRAKLFIPFIQTDAINGFRVFKRKQKTNLTWSGGSPQNILNFDLYRGDQKVMTFPNVANVGHHTIEFPGYVKASSKYRFKISDTKNEDDVVFTDNFKIKRKVPLLLKATVLIGCGSVLYWFTSQTREDDGLPGPLKIE